MRVLEKLAYVFLTNFAPPGTNFVAPPGRNSNHFAPLPLPNSQPATDLRGQGGAKVAEFRPTKKRKNFQWGKNQKLNVDVRTRS
jgi:hypothetical protein